MHSRATLKIDYSSFKEVMQLYTGMLNLCIFQVGFLNVFSGKGGSKSTPTVYFDWKLLEACNFEQSNFNLITIKLLQAKFACL